MDWRPIPGWPLYEASRDGAIRNARTGRVLRARPHPSGYRAVDLHTGKRWGLSATSGQKSHLVHTLVCSAFHGARPTGLEAAHYDGDRSNNAAENLRWATRAENMADKHKHGTEAIGEARHGARLTADKVRAIRADNRPYGAIAADHGVSAGTIGKIKRREKWRHVD